MLGDFTENLQRSSHYDFFLQPWDVKDFEFFIANWDKIRKFVGSKNFKKILVRRESFEFLLQFAVYEKNNDKILEPFLSKLNSTLTRDEMISILNMVDSELEDSHPLALAITYSKLNEIKVLWSYIEEYLDENERKNFFKDEKMLKKSLFNEMPEVFQFVNQIYQKLYTKSQIQDLILGKVSDDFSLLHYGFLYAKNKEVAEELVRFLEEVFQGNEETLKELFEQKIYGGQNLLEYTTNERTTETLKILTELYNKIKLKVESKNETSN